jgi:hypothetical protein
MGLDVPAPRESNEEVKPIIEARGHLDDLATCGDQHALSRPERTTLRLVLLRDVTRQVAVFHGSDSA